MKRATKNFTSNSGVGNGVLSEAFFYHKVGTLERTPCCYKLFDFYGDYHGNATRMNVKRPLRGQGGVRHEKTYWLYMDAEFNILRGAF